MRFLISPRAKVEHLFLRSIDRSTMLAIGGPSKEQLRTNVRASSFEIQNDQRKAAARVRARIGGK
jgi:hypothetical protein